MARSAKGKEMVTIGGDLQPGCLAEKKREQSAEKQKRG
jgi:hypothetical protein